MASYRKLAVLACVLLLSMLASAQNTTTTGQVLDQSANRYCNATITANIQFPNSTTAPKWNGYPLTTTTWSGNANSNAQFSLVLPDLNFVTPTAQYSFTICSTFITQLGQPAPPCFYYQPSTVITGASVDITSQIQASALPLPNNFCSLAGGGGGGGSSLMCSVTTSGPVAGSNGGPVPALKCDTSLITDFNGDLTGNQFTAVSPWRGELAVTAVSNSPPSALPAHTESWIAAQNIPTSFRNEMPPALGNIGQGLQLQSTSTDPTGTLVQHWNYGNFGGGAGNPAGATNSVQINAGGGNFGAITNTVPGATLASQGPNAPVFQTKPWIDVRDQGIDCTGVSDSTAAFQAMINAAPDFSKFLIPENCKILVSTTGGAPKAITIQSRYGLEFWFEGHNANGCDTGGGGPGAAIIDNSSYVSGASIFYINQSQRLLFHNVVLRLNGAVDIGYDVDETTNPPITTANIWENACIQNNVAANSSFKGWRFSNTSTSNVEAQKIFNSYVQCSNNRPANYTAAGSGVWFSGLNSNQKNEVVAGLGSFGCSEDEFMGTGSVFTATDFLMSNSYSSVLDGAFNSLVMGMRTENDTHSINVTNPTGPHTYIHNDFASAVGSPIDCSQGSPTPGCGFITGIGQEADSDIDMINPSPNGSNTTGFLVGNRHLTVNQFEWQGGVFATGALNGVMGFTPILNTFGEDLSPSVTPLLNTHNMASAPLILESAYGTSPTLDPYVVQNMPNGPYGSISNATLVFGAVNKTLGLGGSANWPGTSITRWLAFLGNQSGINLAQSPQPSIPILNFVGTTGSTCYSYEFVAHGNNGTTQASAIAQTCVAAAVLNGSNYVLVSLPSVPGANYYDVYRTQCAGNGICLTNPTGIIGQMAAVIYVNGLQSAASAITLQDIGISADGSTAPTVNTTGNLQIGGHILISPVAPTIASGFGSTPSIVNSNGTAVFEVNVGTGGSATSGVITMPTATTGWSCQISDMSTPSKVTTETAFSTTSITLTASAAWVASDKLLVNCGGF